MSSLVGGGEEREHELHQLATCEPDEGVCTSRLGSWSEALTRLQTLPEHAVKKTFFQKKYGGCGASGRRGDRLTTCTVLEASQERVRYASAPGCPGRWRASLALTDLLLNMGHDAALAHDEPFEEPR